MTFETIAQNVGKILGRTIKPRRLLDYEKIPRLRGKYFHISQGGSSPRPGEDGKAPGKTENLKGPAVRTVRPARTLRPFLEEIIEDAHRRREGPGGPRGGLH